MEECGVVLGHLELVTSTWAMPAVSTERIHLFLAPYRAVDRIGLGLGLGLGLGEEGERISVETVSLDELARRADSGTLTDMKTMLLVLALRHRCPDLFTS